MKLSGLVSINGGKWFESAEVEFGELAPDEPFPSPVAYKDLSFGEVDEVCSMVASAMPVPDAQHALLMAHAALYQDDDAHETCTLTACLNPLHPGPCKGWKGNLFKVAPHAYHALESARVEKANALRVKKIELLKKLGKPIPKKLLQPIVAKPHPHAGKTANAATGEAHTAGQAVSDAAGVHVNEPGKVTLGQAVKQIKATDATPEKGPKGKKPTVASKGIAAVIAQEKVTPQYKLDKAAKITPEQWNALSADEKSIIRGELANIQKEGFGPQQKKASELLDALPAQGLKGGGTDTVTTPKGQVIQKVSVKDAATEKAAPEFNDAQKAALDAFGIHSHLKSTEKKIAAATALTADEFKALPEKRQEDIKAFLKQIHKYNPDLKKTVAQAMVKFTSGNAQSAWQKEADHPGYTPTMTLVGKHLLESGSLGKSKASVQERIDTYSKLTVDEFHNLTPQEQAFVLHELSQMQKQAGKDSKINGKLVAELHAKFSPPAASKTPEPAPLKAEAAKPKLGGGLPNTASPLGIQKLLKEHGSLDLTYAKGTDYEKHFADVGLPGKGDHEHYLVNEGQGNWYVTDKDGKNLQFLSKSSGVHLSPASEKPAKAKLGELTPGTPGTITTPSGKTYQKVELKPETPKIENAAESAPKAPELPKHVQHAAAMANHEALGAGLSKNHLAAYQKLTPEEFKSLPEATQGKIIQELEKGQTKFLDPKKIAAAKELITKFQAGKTSAAPKASEVGFATHLTDHTVSDAQAKKVAAGEPVAVHAAMAKDLAGLEAADSPEFALHSPDAKKYGQILAEMPLHGQPPEVLKDPAVKAAVTNLEAVASDFRGGQLALKAKQSAFSKINMTLKGDQGKLSPIQKASLAQYQQYLLNHPIDTSPETLAKLEDEVTKAQGDLASAIKVAKMPKPDEMSPAQLDSKVGELLGAEAVTPKVNLTMAELKDAHALGKKMAHIGTEKYSAATLENPEVAAKLKAVEQAAGQLAATGENKKKLLAHLGKHHNKAIEAHNAGAGTFNAQQIAVIKAHAEKIKKDHAYLDTVVQEQMDKLTAASKAFDAAADAVQAAPPAPTVLSDYDQATISDAFGNNWAKLASKAVVYGLKTYSQKSEMKAHPEYAGLTQDLGNLQAAVKKLALAHAHEHTAELNIPIDPETGFKLNGPEKKAWLLAAKERMQAEQDYNQLHKVAQAKLDKIRTDVGLKKRALPKIDSPALKAAAAETAYYKTAGYGGPNYNKPAKAKNYLAAKVGPKLGVTHQSAAEKKAEKAADADAVQAAPGAKLEPVTLGGADSSIAGIPDDIKKQITADFKGMPSGKYLADPAADIFDNLVVLAAAHGKTLPGGMSVDQVLKTIDETHAKNLGVANSGMLHKKITDWLGTAEGKRYAESHSSPNAKKVKQLSGEVDLPPGVVLKPGEKVQPVAGPGPHDESIPTSAFKSHTSAEAQAEQDAYKKAQGIVWTSAQKKAMTAYTGNGEEAYTGINNWLRGKTGYAPIVKQYAVDIQSAMMPLREHTLLKRGTGYSGLPFNADTVMDWKGKTFEDKGFTSSSVAGSGGHFSGQPLQLIIEAPKGTPAVFVNGISHYKNSENEMLLAAGTKFKVLDVSKTTGGHVVMRVRIVGDM